MYFECKTNLRDSPQAFILKKTKVEINKGEVVLYKNRVEVRLDQDTVWLSLNQLAELFSRDKSVISRHLHNIFKTKELIKDSVVAFFATTAADGKVYQVEYFNLDMIISVGYRVNSKQGTQFRIWATHVLRKHLVEGYTLNEKRLRRVEAKYQELQKAVTLIGNVAAVEGLSQEARGIARVIAEYSRALDMLDDFDHERLPVPRGTKKASFERYRFAPSADHPISNVRLVCQVLAEGLMICL